MTNYHYNRTTQFTFFDLFIEFHPSPPPNFFLVITYWMLTQLGFVLSYAHQFFFFRVLPQ